MPPRETASNQTSLLEKIDRKLGAFIAVMEEHADQTDETLESARKEIESLTEAVRILTIAIDDIRCEIEWTLRHVVPPRAPAVGLPVTSVPKVRAKREAATANPPVEETADAPPGKLF